MTATNGTAATDLKEDTEENRKTLRCRKGHRIYIRSKYNEFEKRARKGLQNPTPRSQL